MALHTPVKLESLQSCLNGLSQDSGIGSSSQEFPSLQLEKILVPAHLTASTSTDEVASTSTSTTTVARKRHKSDESTNEAKLKENDEEDEKKAKVETTPQQQQEEKPTVSGVAAARRTEDVSETLTNGELCILCNVKPRNSVFVHGRIGHMCSCYKCAMRTWAINKRCPLCNCKVRNVLKVFTP